MFILGAKILPDLVNLFIVLIMFIKFVFFDRFLTALTPDVLRLTTIHNTGINWLTLFLYFKICIDIDGECFLYFFSLFWLSSFVFWRQRLNCVDFFLFLQIVSILEHVANKYLGNAKYEANVNWFTLQLCRKTWEHLKLTKIYRNLCSSHDNGICYYLLKWDFGI